MSKDPVIVIGYLGNMGKRYTAILDYLNHPWFGIEARGIHYDNTMKEQVSGLHVKKYHSIIIATPTHTHMKMIMNYKSLNLPFLCEKPVSFELEDIEYIVNNEIPLTMINQYKNLSGAGGATYYDFYNTGGDGLEWDCINIIGMARQQRAVINNKSPIWNCCINGKKLTLQDVNQAYVEMIKDWLENQEPDYDYLMESHKRSKDGYFEKGTYCDSSKDDKHETTGESAKDDRTQDDAPESHQRVHEKRGVRGRQKRPQSSSSSTDS